MKTANLQVPAPSGDVGKVFATYPAPARKLLLAIRGMLYETADSLPEAGRITETLKWGEPAYLTSAPKSGTTIRLAWSPKRPDSAGIFVNCQTTLLDEWRTLYGETLDLVGNRELRLTLGAPLPADPIRHCLAMALTYHQRKPAQ
ncbi:MULTISPECIES: hypothetical protein [Hyphomonas]|uniref:DUF1801 domain-containing protein n=1 Tax=Hyphomonas adhaerens TaxID=81029 RepID=A0A3B9GZZ7_9PROT|nr:MULTISPECIES: hypothetical protein [Hyphomonas]MBB41669.1 hypothetical protein [Hyphomonas sp.]HAE28019.1 hypothetical protein [Hyphomonas adhaerens]|tara:strand:- start:1653 stop:2087 length:435 start_codon:yes stop_codon:yes gene_type:complete